VFATLFGLATSLGFGAEQVTAGLNFLFGVPEPDLTMILLIVSITIIALGSVMMGLDGGVKRLSELNMILALLLLAFVIVVGRTVAIFSGFFDGLIGYGANVLPLSNFIGREDLDFMHGWTTFYWAWWISWSPFVGMFIARVSRGRTVREFVTCVLIVPTPACVLWMAAFGGTAIEQNITDGYTGVTDTISAWTPELSLFKMLEPLPMAGLLSFIGIVLVIDTITASGKTDAPVAQRVFWCTFEGLIAIALLMGGGLGSLQAAAIATGFPFAIVLVLMVYCTWKGLSAERKAMG
jgi:betaine/carnitine transporter, BCCT family